MVNYLLIVANVLVFIVQYRLSDSPATQLYLLHPDNPQIYQYFSSMFMHGGLWHLLGNMIFLWVFGNAVNDSLGNVGYLAFYLAGGVMAGVGYVLISGVAPVLGASGAISAVTGAFLVLFPRVRVTVLLPLVFVMIPFEISALIFLMLQLAWNFGYTFMGVGGGVAYAAHATGYVFGIVVAGGLLAGRLVPREVYDLPSLLHAWRRRLMYRPAAAGISVPGDLPHVSPPVAGRAPTRWRDQRASFPASQKEQELRRQIDELYADGYLHSAAETYLRLLHVAEDPVLPAPQQLDIAHQLLSEEQYAAAADAFERLVRAYGDYEDIGNVCLMLGLIYSRYLRQDERAMHYLSLAIEQLTQPDALEKARTELNGVRDRLGK